MTTPYPQAARRELISQMVEEVQALMTEHDLSVPSALSQWAMDLWGLTSQDGAHRSDGAGDRGIDWWRTTAKRAEVWQFKCVDDLSEAGLTKRPAREDYADLDRILNWLTEPNEVKLKQNRSLSRFQKEINLEIDRAKKSGEQEFFVHINYVVTKASATGQTKEELNEVMARAKGILEINGVPAEISINIMSSDDILGEMWGHSNPDWTTRSGRGEEWATLHINGRMLDDNKSQIFWCRALDLVLAYKDFGYRLFAPNVRCYLEETLVNEAIRETLNFEKGIREFKYLNNGVTLTYEAIDKKHTGFMKFRKPGVINGLQTIKTLDRAYSELSSEKKRIFEEDCFVLVRAFSVKSGVDVEGLIISTNNQNKMSARNLKSNQPEQKLFEQRFASMDWFYERKEGAWSAFNEDPAGWPTLKGMKPARFGGREKPKRRTIDSEFVAVSWLAFCGYSDQARNEKSRIFEDGDLYKKCFLVTPAKHGFRYNFKRHGTLEDSSTAPEIPPASALLLASLLHSSMRSIVKSKPEIEAFHIKRLSIGDLAREQQQIKLLEDTDFISELMVASSPLTFVELFGLIFFESANGKYDDLAKAILVKTDLNGIYKAKSYNDLKVSLDINPNTNDMFNAVYKLWRSIWKEFAASHIWRASLQSSSSRPSFAHSSSNRTSIYNRVVELDEVISSNPLSRPWSRPFDQNSTVLRAFAKLVK